jgi:hypothetical protein
VIDARLYRRHEYERRPQPEPGLAFDIRLDERGVAPAPQPARTDRDVAG